MPWMQGTSVDSSDSGHRSIETSRGWCRMISFSSRNKL
jgi:hypothetical protein